MLKNLSLVILLCSTLSAETAGSLFVGYSRFDADQYLPPASFVVEPGLSAGLLLPIRIPIVDMHYKVRAASHSVSAIYKGYPGYVNYISAQNTMLCGKTLYSNHFQIKFLPQIGLGLLYENIYNEWGDGYLYNQLFVDFSLRIALPNLSDHFEIMINREIGLESSLDDFLPQRRTHFSLVVTY